MSTLKKQSRSQPKARRAKDEQGQPYVLHPLRAMMDVPGEDAQIAAVLHDVVEDTDVSLDDIRQF